MTPAPHRPRGLNLKKRRRTLSTVPPRSPTVSSGVCLALPGTTVGRELGRQLVRVGTSVGANVEEAQAGESRADFIHKLRIARKECRETGYFRTRLAHAQLLPPGKLEDITDEAEQILRVLTAIIRSTEKKR